MDYLIDPDLNAIHLCELENPYRIKKRKIKDMWGDTCAYCGATGTKENPLTIDHIRPKNRHLRNDHITNRISACLFCNRDKGDRPLEHWYPKHPSFTLFRLQRIIRWMHPGIDDTGVKKALALFLCGRNKRPTGDS